MSLLSLSKSFRNSVFLVSGFLLLSPLLMQSLAEQTADAEKAAVSQSKEGSENDKPNSEGHSGGALSGEGVLKGGVEQVEISLTRMRDVSLDVKTLESDVKGLYGEATRQVVRIDSSPNIIGGVLVNIPYRFETGEYLPPRRKYVNNYIAQIGPNLKLLKEGVNEMECGCRAILVPEGVKEEFGSVVKDWNSIVKQANAHFDELENYVKTSKLTNSELGGRAQELNGDMQGLKATLKEAFKIMKRAQKKNKNDKMVPIAQADNLISILQKV